GSDGKHPRFDKVEKLLEALYEIGNKDIYFGTFPSEVRPEFVTDGSLEMVNKYCTNDRISLGAQSGSERILRDIHRGHTVREV
ncbi:MAG TPA: TIGR04013 family B12-binding domain/radical SAM domain-containing protein, partial [Methanomethylovorans sp.]|nr:TIGR04013 family B12-binding domain/radical SAM domain-containing protein [Methanomethylovorans sp.]